MRKTAAGEEGEQDGKPEGAEKTGSVTFSNLSDVGPCAQDTQAQRIESWAAPWAGVACGAGRALGQSRMYLSALISRGSYPRTDTLVQIAQTCGYRVELVRDGERIELEAD